MYGKVCDCGSLTCKLNSAKSHARKIAPTERKGLSEEDMGRRPTSTIGVTFELMGYIRDDL